MRNVIAIFLFMGLLTTAYSQDIGLKSITAKAGIIMPEDPWETGFHVGASANLGEVVENITLVPFVEYWSTSYDQSFFGEKYGLDLTNFKIGAAGHYDIANVEGLYVGAGLALNFLSVDVVIPNFVGGGTSTSSSSNTEFGAVALAGYRVPLGNMQGVVEAEYNLMDVATLQLNFGVEFDMTK